MKVRDSGKTTWQDVTGQNTPSLALLLASKPIGCRPLTDDNNQLLHLTGTDTFNRFSAAI